MVGKQDGRDRRVTARDADDSETPILHADLDAFFASVELLSRPELRGKPVIVGHPGARSVVTAATYEARRYGVNSAMPMNAALRRCPRAIVIPPNFPAYRAASEAFFEICRRFTPLVERVGIDEGFLDVSGAQRLFGSPAQVAQAIRAAVRDELGIVVSIGVAATKYVAKLASGMSKPDGLLVVPRRETVEFLRPLPLSALWGVGPVTAKKLNDRGFRTAGDIADAELRTLERMVGVALAERLSALSVGRDPRVVGDERAEKSIGHEHTFELDVSDEARLRREVLRLSDRVSRRLRATSTTGRIVAIKVRWADFRTVNRSRTLPEPTDVATTIARVATGLFDELRPLPAPVRLIGVRMERLGDSRAADTLWDPDDDWADAENAAEAVAARFGTSALVRASLMGTAPVLRPRNDGGTIDER